MYNISSKKSENPNVSIIITTYNRPKYLKRAIHSVLSQTFKDLELIVVDDCSTDNTEEVVRSFNDKRIVYHKHEINLGVQDARNNGIKMARGEFIGFLDDDDEYLPTKIQKQVELFKKLPENYGLVYSGFLISDGQKITEKLIPNKRGDVRDHLIKENCLGTLTTLVRKSCFDKVGLFEYMPSIEDWDMWIRISEFYKFDFVPEALSIYLFHESQISGNVKRLIIGRQIMLNKYKEIWSTRFGMLINRLNDLGRLYYFSNFSFQAKRYFIESLRIKFFQKHAILNLLLGKILSINSINLLTPYNSADNILEVILAFFKKKFFQER